MRRMRTPLIVLILVYFFSIIAMMAVPGVDNDGNAYRMSFLDAAYFMAILQTTIGFGEIPFSFTAAQRMLVGGLLLPNVVAWLYSIGTMLGLLLDKQFQAAFHRSRRLDAAEPDSGHWLRGQQRRQDAMKRPCPNTPASLLEFQKRPFRLSGWLAELRFIHRGRDPRMQREHLATRVRAHRDTVRGCSRYPASRGIRTSM